MVLEIQRSQREGVPPSVHLQPQEAVLCCSLNLLLPGQKNKAKPAFHTGPRDPCGLGNRMKLSSATEAPKHQVKGLIPSSIPHLPRPTRLGIPSPAAPPPPQQQPPRHFQKSPSARGGRRVLLPGGGEAAGCRQPAVQSSAPQTLVDFGVTEVGCSCMCRLLAPELQARWAMGGAREPAF